MARQILNKFYSHGEGNGSLKVKKHNPYKHNKYNHLNGKNGDSGEEIRKKRPLVEANAQKQAEKIAYRLEWYGEKIKVFANGNIIGRGENFDDIKKIMRMLVEMGFSNAALLAMEASIKRETTCTMVGQSYNAALLAMEASIKRETAYATVGQSYSRLISGICSLACEKISAGKYDEAKKALEIVFNAVEKTFRENGNKFSFLSNIEPQQFYQSAWMHTGEVARKFAEHGQVEHSAKAFAQLGVCGWGRSVYLGESAASLWLGGKIPEANEFLQMVFAEEDNILKKNKGTRGVEGEEGRAQRRQGIKKYLGRIVDSGESAWGLFEILEKPQYEAGEVDIGEIEIAAKYFYGRMKDDDVYYHNLLSHLRDIALLVPVEQLLSIEKKVFGKGSIEFMLMCEARASLGDKNDKKNYQKYLEAQRIVPLEKIFPNMRDFSFVGKIERVLGSAQEVDVKHTGRYNRKEYIEKKNVMNVQVGPEIRVALWSSKKLPHPISLSHMPFYAQGAIAYEQNGKLEIVVGKYNGSFSVCGDKY